MQDRFGRGFGRTANNPLPKDLGPPQWAIEVESDALLVEAQAPVSHALSIMRSPESATFGEVLHPLSMPLSVGQGSRYPQTLLPNSGTYCDAPSGLRERRVATGIELPGSVSA